MLLVGLLAGATLAALPGASLLTEPASAVVTPVVMTSVCVNSAQGQMSYPIGGTCAAGQTSYPVDDPAHLLPTCYLQSNGAIRKVSGPADCTNAPRSKKELFLLVPSLTNDQYFCADSTSGALFFKGTSPVNCPAKQFLVVVKQANHPPVASAQSVSLNEDASKLITLTGSDPDAQPITFKITTLPGRGELFKGNSTAAADKITSVPTIIPSSGTSADVTYKPEANYFGADSFQFKTSDPYTDSAAATVSITVDSVNDAPSFTKGADQSVDEDSGAQTVPNWATAISPGPNESGQTVSFTITGDTNPGLFSTGPAVASNGTLTYTPAPDANGVATITLKAVDDGGTANGGVDESAPQSFTITVTAVNDPPSFTGGGDQTVLEDSGPHSSSWATAISPGPSDEAGQTVSFLVTGNTNPGLFSAGPAISSAGTLTFTPAADAYGDATITVIARDDGSPPADSAPTSFKIMVTPVNDAPSFDTLAGDPPTVNEDVTAQTVNGFATGMSAGPANESSQTLQFVIVSNSNPGLFVPVSGEPLVDATTGNLTYTPAPDASGSAVITIKLMDDGGTANGGVDESPTQQFTITVNPVNDAPSFQLPASPDQTALEDSGAHTVGAFATAISAGPSGESSQTLTFNVTNGNNALFSVQPDIDETTGDLTYTLAANANGSATVSVFLSDDGGTANGGSDTSGTQTFQIVVTAVNDEPSFDLLASPNQTVVQGSGPQTVSAFATNILAGPADESGQALSFHVSADNTALFTTQPSIDPSTGTLTYEPADTTGSAIVSVYLTDDGGTANGGDDTSPTQTFTITVVPPNATPVADGQSVSTTEDTPKTITLSASDTDDDALTFSIVSGPSHGSLGSIGAPDCSAVNTCTATVDYTPAANYAGPDSFTFKANDVTADSNTATVDIDVTAVNDAPSFTKGADESVLEDSGAHSVPGWATAISPGGGADEAGQTVTFTVTNNTNPALFSAGPAVAADGTLTYTLAADAFGSATITLKAVDNGSPPAESPTQSFVIDVTGVNDAPSFTKGADQTIAEDAGAQSVPNWATGISAGPNESGQTVSFVVTNNSNASLFSAAPAVSPTGTLTYTPAANQHGTATITLQITDNGGTANGGVDTSPTQSFDITVTAVNDPPTSPGRAYGANSLETNMKRSIAAADGLLVGAADANDVAGNAGYTPTFTVGTVNGVAPSGGTITTTIAGVGTVVADAATGAFTIDPAPGVTGNVSFNFTVCDNGDGTPASQCSSTATASFNIAGPVIWFVNPSAVTNGAGTLASPFNVLASADAVDAANHRVFVYSGPTATGLALNSGEWLIGQGATGTDFDTLMSISPPAGTIARPSINGTRPVIGGQVSLNASTKVQGVDITPGPGAPGLTDTGGHLGIAVSETAVTATNAAAVDLNGSGGSIVLSSASSTGSTSSGIALTNVTASVSAAAGSITNATGADVAISGGNGAFTYDGSISDDVGTLVSVSGATGGTKSFNGSLTDGDDGDGSGISLTGNTGATVNFTAGLILSTGANPAFTASGGGTVNVTGAPSTLTTTTGTALNVTSTNIGASGTTFRSISSNGGTNGIVLNNTGASGGLTVTGSGGVCTFATQTCTGGAIQSKTGDAISLTNTANPSLSLMNVHNNAGNGVLASGVSALSISNSIFVANSDDVATNNEANLRMLNLSGTSTITSSLFRDAVVNNVYWTPNAGSMTLNVTSSTFGPNSATTGGSGLLLDATGTAAPTLSITGGSFSGNRGDSLRPAFSGSASGNVTVSGGTQFTDSNSGVNFSVDSNADLTYNVTGSTFLRHKSHALQMIVNDTATASSSVHGTAASNTIGDTTADSGSHDANGISFDLEGGGAIVLSVTGNTIKHTDTQGIFVQSRRPISPGSAGPGVDLTLRNNSVANIDDNSAFPFIDQWGTEVWSRNSSNLCLDMAGNTSAHVGAGTDFRLRQRDTSTFRLERFVGNGASTADVNAYILGQNPGGFTASSTIATSFTGVADGTCQNP